MNSEMNILETEINTFQAHHNELLGTSNGKFVLIYGEELIGVFESQEDALDRGYEKYGNQPFLVRQVLDVETPFNFTSFQLAV